MFYPSNLNGKESFRSSIHGPLFQLEFSEELGEAQGKSLCRLHFVDLSRFAQSGLDDVTIVVVELQNENPTLQDNRTKLNNHIIRAFKRPNTDLCPYTLYT